MTPEAIVNYLKQHPEFFEDHADFLSSVAIAHPHGGRAISIGERQVLALRDKGRQLEEKLRELIQYGEENDAISEKLHRLTLALVEARDAQAVIEALHFHLREDFAVPHSALRLWPSSDMNLELAEFSPASTESHDFAESLTQPYCSAHAMVDTGSWFGEQSALLRSFAYVPLKNGPAFGLLALASEDAQRFYPEMGTMYLRRLGETAQAGLRRTLT